MSASILFIIVSLGVFAGNLLTLNLQRLIEARALTLAWKRQLQELAAQEEAAEEVK